MAPSFCALPPHWRPSPQPSYPALPGTRGPHRLPLDPCFPLRPHPLRPSSPAGLSLPPSRPPSWGGSSAPSLLRPPARSLRLRLRPPGARSTQCVPAGDLRWQTPSLYSWQWAGATWASAPPPGRGLRGVGLAPWTPSPWLAGAAPFPPGAGLLPASLIKRIKSKHWKM